MADTKGGGKPTENIFRIMDEIVYQLTNTKKMFILMIISVIIAVPATHVISSALIGPPYPYGQFPRDRFGPPDGDSFRLAQAVVVGVVLFWVAIGIRQWFILSKWTKKYGQYKALQKKIDEKLDYDDENDKANDKS